MKIAHLIPRLQHGGALRATIDLAREMQRRYNIRSALVSPGSAHPDAVAWAQEAGLQVILPDSPETMGETLGDADIVHVTFWNTPEMYAWLRSPLPPMRLVMTLHVHGEFPSQAITAPLLRFADWLVPTGARTLALPVWKETLQTRPERVTLIPGTLRFPDTLAPRAANLNPRVGYVGTVDFAKMHPRFVQFCAAVDLPRVVFPVAGRGGEFQTLARRAEQSGIASQMEWLGYQHNVDDLFASFDIFGYPLCRETFATSDLVVQQAMWHGVPPVILPYGGLPELVRHDETGMIVSEQDYPDALRELVSDDRKRAQLGANAAAYAREHFGVEHTAPTLFAVYQNALGGLKSERVWQGEIIAPRFPGASDLVQAFGDGAAKYRASLESNDMQAVRDAEYRIAHALPGEMEGGAGGILAYRYAYPDDAVLRLWSGLVLAQQKRFALAAAEFTAARQMDLAPERVAPYLERVLAHKMIFEDPA